MARGQLHPSLCLGHFAAGIAGFADTHSAAVSVASLVAAGKLSANEAVLPILASLTTNTITKVALAVISGNRRFVSAIVPGLVLVRLAAWIEAGVAVGVLTSCGFDFCLPGPKTALFFRMGEE